VLGGVLILSFCANFELFLLFWAFVLILSFSCSFELFLALLCHFVWLCRFSCLLLDFAVFLLRDDLLGFLDLLAVLYGILDSNFKLCDFIVNGLIMGEIEKPSGQFLGLIVMSHWLGKIWIQIRDSFHFIFLLFIFRLENRVFLSCGVQVVGVAWRAAMTTVAGVGDLVQRIGDGYTGQVLGGWTVERPGGTVCGLHLTRGD
jgi:hypothetical protein